MLGWFKRWFEKNLLVYPAPVVRPAPVTPAHKNRVAIVVGHNSRARGAIRVTDGKTEFEWNSVLAEMIANKAPGQYRVFHRVSGGGYTNEVQTVYADVDAWGAVIAIELHFNSNANPSATGTETLTSGTKGSVKLANLMQDAMVKALGLRDRGLVYRKRKENGGESLFAGRAPCVLLEPYFGSNVRDCATADRNVAALVDGIHTAAMAYSKE